jgi:hypothetical protein
VIDPYTAAGVIVRHYNALGLELPPDAADAFALGDAAVAAGDKPVPLAVAPRIEAGTITPDELAEHLRATALESVIAERIVAHRADALRSIGKKALGAFTGDTDRVAAEMADRYAEAADAVVDATRVLGPGDWEVLHLVANRSSGAADAVHAVRGAVDGTLDPLRGLLLAVAASTRTPESPARYVKLTDRATVNTLVEAGQAFAHRQGPAKWLAMLSLPGVEPSLNTADEMAAVVAHSERLAARAHSIEVDQHIARQRLRDPMLRDAPV